MFPVRTPSTVKNIAPFGQDRTQSSLGRAMRELEERVGGALFERIGRKLAAEGWSSAMPKPRHRSCAAQVFKGQTGHALTPQQDLSPAGLTGLRWVAPSKGIALRQGEWVSW